MICKVCNDTDHTHCPHLMLQRIEGSRWCRCLHCLRGVLVR